MTNGKKTDTKCKCNICNCNLKKTKKMSEEEFWEILNKKSTISPKRGANKNSKKIASYD